MYGVRRPLYRTSIHAPDLSPFVSIYLAAFSDSRRRSRFKKKKQMQPKSAIGSGESFAAKRLAR